MVSGTRPRRTAVLVMVGVGASVVGYLGQGSVGIGVQADPPAVAAVVTDAVGGVGTRQPVRLLVSIAVTNSGERIVKVSGPERPGPGAAIRGLTPRELDVGAGQTLWIDADVAVSCRGPGPIRLPDLQLDLPDGTRRPLPVGGSGVLLQGCARTAATARPLSATVSTPAAGDPQDPSDHRLTVELTSPTGRRAEVLAVRVGGVPLAGLPPAAAVAGRAVTFAHLEPPRPCPPAWQVTGIPTTLSVDLGPADGRAGDGGTGAGDPAVTTLQLRLGPALTSWLLSTACASS